MTDIALQRSVCVAGATPFVWTVVITLPPKPAKPQQPSSVGVGGGSNNGAKDGGAGGSLQEAEWYWGDIS
ncbi:phosphoinositide-3-kinase, regulatory subunit 3b (gamma) isoform X2, partial [Lates japonicus]